MVFVSRLDEKIAIEKMTNQIKQYAEQAQWSGTELIVKPCWFKRLCFAVIWLGIFLACLKGVSIIGSIAGEKPLLFSFIGASLVFGYSAWLTLAGFVREILAGYSLKLNSHGFTLAGHPTMPWRGVYRAGHMSINNKGFVHHFLELEFSADEIQNHWPSKIRPFLIGPLVIAWPILRHRGEFKLRGTFLALPVPTIVTAICQIGSRHAPHPVVQLNQYESLEDARRLAVLWAKARQPIDQSEQEMEFKRAAADFSKPGGVVDSVDLDAAMAKLDRDLTAQSNAFSEYLQLQNKVRTQSSKQFSKQINRDIKILYWIFGGAFLLIMLYYLLRYIVGLVT